MLSPRMLAQRETLARVMRRIPAPLGRRATGHRPWPVLPLVLILLSLVGLALLPLLVERQVAALRWELQEVSDPARRQVRVIQVQLALETAGTRGYLLTGDATYALRHRAARARRQEALARLGELADRSVPEVHALAQRLAGELRPADAVLDSLFRGQLGRAAFLARLPRQQARLEQVTATAEEVARALSRRSLERLAGVQRLERWAAGISLMLVAVALLAAFLVVRLGSAYHRMALRASTARAESEAARAEAERRREEVEQLASSRERLVRGFTHDVKNPLGAAAGYLALLEEGLMEPAEALRRARRTITAALALTEEVLELARAESGELSLRREPVDLLQVVREAAEDCRGQAEAKGLSLVVESLEALPPVESDPARVRQILGNLLSNAVKYTHTGGVTVSVGTRAGVHVADRSTWAAVAVTDTGPGLTAEEIELLFEEFRRLGSAAGVPGSGLGLAISKRLARLLEGDVVVQSVPGAGSTFSLLLPCPQATAVPASPPALVATPSNASIPA